MRIRYILRCLLYYIVEIRFSFISKGKVQTKELLILYTDAIGDYVLFRNFINVIKQSEKYKNYSITLCGNQAYKELAIHFDSTIIDKFVWLNRTKFEKDFSYRRKFLRLIREQNFDIVLNPSYSRDFIFGDSIVRQAKADIKIGQITNTANTYRIFTLLSDRWYTTLYNTGDGVIFDFFRNKQLIQMFVEEDIELSKPLLSEKSEKEAFLIIFPGAGEKQKQWKVENFAKVASYIAKKENLKIVVCGSDSDRILGEEIKEQLRLDLVSNLCGKTSLVELTQLIAKASLLLTNDSSALHIAACTNTRAICVGNGRHYGRFTPYPEGMAPNLHFIFPEKVEQMAKEDLQKLKKLTIKQSIASIQDIEVDAVIRLYNQGV